MKKLLACIALGCIATANSYAGTPLWMRDVQISPDGKEIVFCYTLIPQHYYKIFFLST